MAFRADLSSHRTSTRGTNELILLCLGLPHVYMCQLGTDLQQQPLKRQAGIPAGHDGVAKRLGRGQAELEHPTVTL